MGPGPGGPGGGYFRGRREQMTEKLKEPKPQSLREVPDYLKRLISKFFYRLFYIFRLVWDTRPWILLFMVFMAVWNGVTPVISAYIGAALLNGLAEAYMSVTTGGEIMFDTIVWLLLLRFGFNFLTGMVSRISNILNNISGELVVNHVNLKIMNKAREVDLASFDDPEFYERFENAKREAGSRPINILNNNFTIISTVISMVSFIVILAAVSPWAPVVIALMSVPTAVISFAYRKKNFWYVRWHSKDRRQMNYYSELMTNKDMVKEIRLFNLSDNFIGRYQETFLRYFGGLKKLFIGEGCWNIGINLLTTTINCLLFLYIAKGVAEGRYAVGDYSLYTGALSSITNGVTRLISTSATIYEGTLFIDNMIAFMKEEQSVVPRLAEPLHVQRHIGHTLELRDVSFHYPGTERMVIRHVNLTLRAGETAVLVGLNGAGKTTLIKLITRLYDPTEGEIYLDGRDIRDYDLSELYAMYGIIFQDFGKYAVSVSENIHYGDILRDADDADIRSAAEASSADLFIRDLPNGYDTPLMRVFEDNGIELSGGQWQKLSIARAFYSDSDILILDEPTASLDPMAEQEIFNQFDTLRQDKTTIFVSHRLSSATSATKIIVLEAGEIVEEGTHAELMALRGKYYTLFSTQAKRYVTGYNAGDAPSDAAPEQPEKKPPMPDGAPSFPFGAPPGGAPRRGSRGTFPQRPPTDGAPTE